MAALLNRNLNDTERFCMQYFTSEQCSNPSTCDYTHRKPQEVDMVYYPAGEQYFYGRQRECSCHRPCSRRKNTCPYVVDQAPKPSHREAAEAPNAGPNTMDKPSTSRENKQDQKRAGKGKKAQANGNLTIVKPSYDTWVNAPEFVPKSAQKSSGMTRSYAQAVNAKSQAEGETTTTNHSAPNELCPHMDRHGVCHEQSCSNSHFEICDMCERLVLNPLDENQRKQHRQECLEQHEKNMELSFAVARSKEKTCGICFEVVMEKVIGEQRFGILPNCNHCFCLSCIRKWRQARQFEKKIIRACPECRVTSDFVCPSMFWVDTKEDKSKLIEDYKGALAQKHCKYFKRGKGKCLFGNKCFYLHALVDGTKCDVGPPIRQWGSRALDSTELGVLQHVMLWDFLDDREFPWQMLVDEFEDLGLFLTDSEESDWSDNDIVYSD